MSAFFLEFRLFCLLCFAAFSAFNAQAQAVRASESFVLPKGVNETSFQWVISIDDAKIAELAEFNLLDADGGELPTDVTVSKAFAKTFYARRKPKFFIEFTVSRTNTTDNLDLLAEVAYSVKSKSLTSRSGPVEPSESVLATGRIFKLAVDETGIYQLDADFLKDLGFSTSGSPAEVRVYSKGGAMLPERVGEEFPVDLQEIPLLEVGNQDGIWNSGEKLLFYGEGEDVWEWDVSDRNFVRRENLYAEETYYYVKVGGTGKRITQLPAVVPSSYSTTYSNRVRWEEDLQNLLYFSKKSRFSSGQGSGQDWFGYHFGTDRDLTKNRLFNLGELVPGQAGTLTARLAASATTSNTRFSVALNGVSYTSGTISRGTRGNADFAFANFGLINEDVTLNSGSVDVSISYPGTMENALGWIDFVQLVYPCVLKYTGEVLPFRSVNQTAAGDFGFEISSTTGDFKVLDVSDPLLALEVPTTSAGGVTKFGYFKETTSAPREFIGFEASRTFPRPENKGEVRNSNLHGISKADMIIVYGEGLENAAQELAKHRRSYNSYDVAVASMQEIMEEFGGGRPDPTSIRAFAKMIYTRSTDLKYILLLGDGSFDPRGIQEDRGNLIPTYQTAASNHEVSAYPTDDYFGLLDDGEGRSGASYPQGALDVGVGRIPASTSSQADIVINKIIRYETDAALLGDWRLRTVFVADDEDSNRHVNDMDGIAIRNSVEFPVYNQVKIYADAYEQIPTPGGPRIPRAAEAINQNMFRGNLLTTYLGHGGPNGWGQERFLNAPDIEKWDSQNAYTVLVTATCTFTGFDDPEEIVAGEAVLFKSNGGAVASLSTVRPVFITENRAIADQTHKFLLTDSLSKFLGLGLVLAEAKNATGDISNNRKYSLFGDPAMKLAVPKLKVVVTNFDSIDLATQLDTASVEALREIVVRGEIRDDDGNFKGDFSGEILLTVFDQNVVARTLGQDAGSRVKEFDRQGNTLFTGRASVTNGLWEAKFMLPKDLSIAKGSGRLSLYARSSDGRDGSGLFERFFIDGISPPAQSDDSPPTVSIFLGDENFVPGGTTNKNPILLVKLTDDTGINVSGSSIGHDLTATLRGGKNGDYVLNDFYQAETDDYSKGEVQYPIFDLPEGEYEVSVRAWDLANNTGEGTSTFVVSNDPNVALSRVLNYPNPFVDATCFQFEHTASGQFVEVQVDIYTSSGRRVKSLRYEGVAQGNRFGNDDCIEWDGTDDFGQRLARGVYLYKVALRTDNGDRNGESGFERLVVLR